MACVDIMTPHPTKTIIHRQMTQHLLRIFTPWSQLKSGAGRSPKGAARKKVVHTPAGEASARPLKFSHR